LRLIETRGSTRYCGCGSGEWIPLQFWVLKPAKWIRYLRKRNELKLNIFEASDTISETGFSGMFNGSLQNRRMVSGRFFCARNSIIAARRWANRCERRYKRIAQRTAIDRMTGTRKFSFWGVGGLRLFSLPPGSTKRSEDKESYQLKLDL